MSNINPYIKYQTSTLSPEEAIIKLHEKIFERIEIIADNYEKLKVLPPEKFEDKKKILTDEIASQLDLIIDSIDAIKNMIDDNIDKKLKDNIYSVYNLFKVHLIKACYKEDIDLIKDCKEIIMPLYESWKGKFSK